MCSGSPLPRRRILDTTTRAATPLTRRIEIAPGPAPVAIAAIVSSTYAGTFERDSYQSADRVAPEKMAHANGMIFYLDASVHVGAERSIHHCCAIVSTLLVSQ